MPATEHIRKRLNDLPHKPGNYSLTNLVAALQCEHFFETDEAFYRQIESSAKARREDA